MVSDDEKNNEQETLLEFPCEFPIKVMGRSSSELIVIVEQIVSKHVEEQHLLSLKETPSRAGNYVGVTVTVIAHSKPQLDAIYMDLTDHDLVIMAL